MCGSSGSTRQKDVHLVPRRTAAVGLADPDESIIPGYGAALRWFAGVLTSPDL
jgi:hypothetical protein